MKTWDLFSRTAKYRKTAFIILAITAFLLGSAYYKVDSGIVAYTVHNSEGLVSSLSTSYNKLPTTKGSTLVSKRNKSGVESVKGYIDVKEEKRKPDEDYNNKIPEVTASTVVLDYSHNISNYRNKLNDRNFNTTRQLEFPSQNIKYFAGRNMKKEENRQVQKKFPTIKYDTLVGAEIAYDVHNLESLRINKTDGSTFVLLVTYARSGSSWLGAIANQAEESFYVFEPFQNFINQGYYKENLVCYNDNTCREPRSFLETHYYAITALHRLFTCQFTKMHPKAVNILIKNARSGDIKKCLLTSSSLKKCLQELEKVCMATTHRVIKTIRISMELVSQMMDLWPNLKVVHLVRDPRGITNSRLKNKAFPMTKKVVPHSHSMCERMYNDVTCNILLEKKYENRIKLVIYEALAERPEEGMEFIYGFLNMKVTKNVITWVYNSTHAQSKNGYFGTRRTDATKSARSWKTILTLFDIRMIDKICNDVYKVFGFLPIGNRTEQEKSSFLSRRSLKHADWFT